ncbi:hypothetical protein ACFVS2_20725 [Brevibacillus sp. NPDC058079]|uniref:hypothetical protein n=1 Tax=Brevibacillus sp. NPDC058079 TaxID=3346330 RepID=UPI0036E82CFF
MEITGVSNANIQSIQMKQLKQPQKTEKTKEQGQQIHTNGHQNSQEVAKKQEGKVSKIEMQADAQKAETQSHNVTKQKDTTAQLLKRMEAQAAMHPAFHQVQEQKNALSKVEATKETTRVAATTNANTERK